MKSRYDKIRFHNQQNLEMAFNLVSGMEIVSQVSAGE